jgi:hypothetical protein
VQPENSDPYSSRPYKVAFTVAVLLFLATLTATALVIIIANARQESHEDRFDITLTALSDRMIQTETALAATPTPAPPLVFGHYPFTLGGGRLVYTAAETCEQQVLDGYVYDQQDNPTDAFRIAVWGDYLSPQFLSTGAAVEQAEGQWTLRQVMAAERYVSAPVEVVFSAGDCAQNRVQILFVQIAPLD